jgi:hypothetical protein
MWRSNKFFFKRVKGTLKYMKQKKFCFILFIWVKNGSTRTSKITIFHYFIRYFDVERMFASAI